MNNRALRAAMYLALGMSMAGALPLTAQAATNDGSLVGRLTDGDSKPLANAEVTVRNPETGFTRTVSADADGYYRFPFLPVGKYVVEATKNGATLGKLADVTVSLGAATTANVTLAMTTLEEVQVLGTRIVTVVDVKSTESATNVTREDLERLPVERDLLSVAMLAPGLNRGDPDLGGVSFGGSSIAENSVYINGLNVTDFYNRVGQATVPYLFYKEFQVKTGGYSVEFGRTTGGVINAVTRSGTNEFEFGTEVLWEPSSLQSKGTNRYKYDGRPHVINEYDEYDRVNATAYASGPIVKDKLFFFALYEARNYQPVNTDNLGANFFEAESDDAFWGAKVDWQMTDNHLLELLAFSDASETLTDQSRFDLATGSKTSYVGTTIADNGGLNWSASYTGYLTDGLSMKALYGQSERETLRGGPNDPSCNRVIDRRSGTTDRGCTPTAQVIDRTDTREAARLDFEWVLGDHQLRFGMDREENTSDHSQAYPGADRLLYEIFPLNPAQPATINGVLLPLGTSAYVRTRQNEIIGEFETLNTAYYLEDNWSITDTFVLNAGLRLEAFDNKDADGQSYIKMDDMLAPRVGFSWDMRGDNRTKLFGNAGRYFLPVANVINIKQSGPFLDRRTFYFFNGLQDGNFNGTPYQLPILGAQIGPVDVSQGDGTVGDLREEVDADMDPVYQDELILGFQSMIDDKWSWGVRGIYRNLENAIDDMNILSTGGGLCAGRPNRAGFVMANPGQPLTIFTDTNCDGVNDAWVTIDTSADGWASFTGDNGNGTYLGRTSGFPDPKRTYTALEFMIDRAWDDRWSMNASYTLSYSKGNAEGPVNSDFNFADTGRTEAFDDPYVNSVEGYLPNDRRHQLKLRGSFALNEHWQFGAALAAASGRPISRLGLGNPVDGEIFHSFYTCVSNCAAPVGQRVFELRERGSEGRTPWTFDLGVNVTYRYSFAVTDLQVKLAVYNVLNQERATQINEQYESAVGNANADFGLGMGWQTPRYATLALTLDF